MNAKIILDADVLKRSLTRISFEIIEQNKNLNDLVLVGIKTRGITLAKRIAVRIEELENIQIPVAELDITYFRDDKVRQKDDVAPTFPFSVLNKTVIVVDDVLYTGRTIRAALDAILNIERPKRIALAVLIDRGHRELPIRPDYVGKNIPTSSDEDIKVHLIENDGLDEAILYK